MITFNHSSQRVYTLVDLPPYVFSHCYPVKLRNLLIVYYYITNCKYTCLKKKNYHTKLSYKKKSINEIVYDLVENMCMNHV